MEETSKWIRTIKSRLRMMKKNRIVDGVPEYEDYDCDCGDCENDN